MRAVQDNPVRFQRGHAFPVQIFVGQDVVVVFHCLQPGDDRQVGRKLPRRAEPRRAIFRPEVDDRTAVGGVADACAVVVLVVGGETELDVVLVDLDIDLLEDRRLGRNRLQRGAIECGADIGVGKIARCRDQQADRRPTCVAGTDEERCVLLGIARRELDGVDAALELIRNGQRQRRLPVAIDERVGVQLDAAVFSGRKPKAVVAAGPVPARQATHRSIVALGVQLMGTDVHHRVADPVLGIARGRVPVGEHARGIRPGSARGRHRAPGDRAPRPGRRSDRSCHCSIG